MRVRCRLALIITAHAMCVVVAPPVGAAPGPHALTPRPATYRVAVEKDVLITMSDGAVLDADIYRPNSRTSVAARRWC
jgi:predicted acyl esterase